MHTIYIQQLGVHLWLNVPRSFRSKYGDRGAIHGGVKLQLIARAPSSHEMRVMLNGSVLLDADSSSRQHPMAAATNDSITALDWVVCSNATDCRPGVENDPAPITLPSPVALPSPITLATPHHPLPPSPLPSPHRSPSKPSPSPLPLPHRSPSNPSNLALTPSPHPSPLTPHSPTDQHNGRVSSLGTPRVCERPERVTARGPRRGRVGDGGGSCRVQRAGPQYVLHARFRKR